MVQRTLYPGVGANGGPGALEASGGQFDSGTPDRGRSITVNAPGCGPGDGGSIPLGHSKLGRSTGVDA